MLRIIAAYTVDQFQVKVLDSANNILSSTGLYRKRSHRCGLKSLHTFICCLVRSKNTEIKVNVIPVGFTDINLSDNTASATIGLADIAVQNIVSLAPANATNTGRLGKISVMPPRKILI